MDDKFHRLLWITLVAVAFTFTVILTSVFVDIDDLLAKRSSHVKQQVVTEVIRTEGPEALVEDFQSFPSNEEDTDENDSTYRTKRSLESSRYLRRIKSPKMKKILTNRLATLLEELDEEESSKTTNSAIAVADSKDKNIVNQKYPSTEHTVKNEKILLNNKDRNYEKRNKVGHNDVLHLAMHNILLQGIVGHMDLNDVYKRVQLLVKSFDNNANADTKEMYAPQYNETEKSEKIKTIPQDSYPEEERFFNELLKCDKLKKEISQSQGLKVADKKEKVKDPPMFIKTIIEITNVRGKENFSNSRENSTDAVKFVYNGKEIKSLDINDNKNFENEADENTEIEVNQHNLKESELDRAIEKYLKTRSLKFYDMQNLMAKRSYVTKRLKRQIKIRYLDNKVTTEKSKIIKGKPKSHDDELYVEIETHFDGKGTKGEKKKKLVRTLIDKIQKAINSNAEFLDENKTIKKQHLQIKKRMQNLIDHNQLITSTTSRIGVIEHRNLNPISKTANVIQPLSSVLDKSGDTWKKIYDGPGFLTASKSLNSAEMRELDIDYNSVMKNGIPKRLQKPINTDNEDLTKPNQYADIGNVTLFLKDINGSGFSIGINQYTDEPPDEETLKMFTGLENLIQTYHERYDQAEAVSSESEYQADYDKTNHDIKKRDTNKYVKLNAPRFTLDDKVMDKAKERNKLFSVTQRSRRKRSAINIKLFSNLKSKTKLNKFINTNPMATKKIFLKTKRNRRQVDKIRIIATDHYRSPSREDIYLDSRENIHADRAVVKEEELPEVEIGDRNDERYDFIAPYPYNMDILNVRPAYLTSSYDTKSLQPGLMSKYPHIIFENISKSKEIVNVSPGNTIEEKNNKKINPKTAIRTINYEKSNENNMSTTNVGEIVDAILPSRNNFKLVVKIFPKNKTNVGPGYKEVHTLINKSYDKNGVRYVSSLNVSEISKFENLNKTKEVAITANNNEMEKRQNEIKLLLQMHKEGIDQQLKHLKMESHKLNQLIGPENSSKNLSHLIDEFSQLVLQSSVKQNFSRLNVLPTTTPNIILSQTKTTMKPLLATVNKIEDSDKLTILTSIKQNENITREILEKIDKNTNTMQLFLKKISDQLQSTQQPVINKHIINDKVIDSILEKLHSNFTDAIPFVYAFQHPLTGNENKPTNTVANVVYHGHIHAHNTENYGGKNDFTNNVTKTLIPENKNRKNKSRNTYEVRNGTKFFIDELDNEYKLVSSPNDPNPVFVPVKKNSNKGIRKS